MKRISSLFFAVPVLIVFVVFADPCIRFDPTENCTSYPITDFCFGLPAGQSGDNMIIRDMDLATSLGWMFVMNESIDLDPSLFFSSYRNGGWHSQIGIRANLRYNLNNAFNLNLSPGVIISDSPFPDGFAGYTTELSVGWKDWVGLSARLDIVDTFQSNRNMILHPGLRFGSYAGLGLTAAGAICGGVAYMENQMD
ncbi:MAG: hypothetical protein KAR40_13195 [Candidatus Sabulitectum sp.]|nr:hypothetical protein [Candidatus Sabulitectum sp.]